MNADYFTHLRAIRTAEDRLRFLRDARTAYSRAMLAYLAQLDREIAREESALAEAHTDRVPGNEPCLAPASRIRRQSN
jgi:hypothetical protein